MNDVARSIHSFCHHKMRHQTNSMSRSSFVRRSKSYTNKGRAFNNTGQISDCVVYLLKVVVEYIMTSYLNGELLMSMSNQMYSRNCDKLVNNSTRMSCLHTTLPQVSATTTVCCRVAVDSIPPTCSCSRRLSTHTDIAEQPTNKRHRYRGLDQHQLWLKSHEPRVKRRNTESHSSCAASESAGPIPKAGPGPSVYTMPFPIQRISRQSDHKTSGTGDSSRQNAHTTEVATQKDADMNCDESEHRSQQQQQQQQTQRQRQLQCHDIVDVSVSSNLLLQHRQQYLRQHRLLAARPTRRRSKHRWRSAALQEALLLEHQIHQIHHSPAQGMATSTTTASDDDSQHSNSNDLMIEVVAIQSIT
jgi:hypothetical protein